MESLKEKINIAIQKGLFDTTNRNEQNNQVFDLYGNYSFPTDFSKVGGNTIASIDRSKFFQCSKNNSHQV